MTTIASAAVGPFRRFSFWSAARSDKALCWTPSFLRLPRWRLSHYIFLAFTPGFLSELLMNDRQRALLLFINERIRTTGTSPTMHEMAGAIGNKHRSGAHRYLAILEADGWIRRIARQKQAIEVLRIPGNVTPTELAREEVISRLADELTRSNISVNEAQRTTTMFASWILEKIEAAGFQLIENATRRSVDGTAGCSAQPTTDSNVSDA